MSKDVFRNKVNSDEIAGRVIRLCAVFEDRVNNILAEYFALHDRWADFHEHFLERMSLVQKLDLLQKLDFGRGSKSRTNLVASLKACESSEMF